MFQELPNSRIYRIWVFKSDPVKLEASAVFLISLESLREVYLFETGLDEASIES